MSGNIFISYRRGESSGIAGRLHDRMAETFGESKLFMDVDNIPVGRDFEDYLHSQVETCDDELIIQRLSGGLTSSNNYKQKLDPRNQIYRFRPDGQTLYLTYESGTQAFYRFSQ
jgi:hypothetical protein